MKTLYKSDEATTLADLSHILAALHSVAYANDRTPDRIYMDGLRFTLEIDDAGAWVLKYRSVG